MNTMVHFIILFLTILYPLKAGIDQGGHYSIENIKMPSDVPPEVGALAIKGDTLYIALRRGDIIYSKIMKDPNEFSWKRFSTGYHNPCGMEFDKQGRLLVSQMGELNRLTDSDGDGKADLVETLCHWGLSGNYHETVEMCPDGSGGFYLAIGTASHNGPTFKWVKEEYSKVGRRGRNFSSVKWRGWVMHYTKEGKLVPHASGFRMHNGIARDSKGMVWATDNQGDWKGTTPLYHIEKGKFYGHPSSLVWDPKWPKGKDPLHMSLIEIDKMRTMPAIQIPHAEQIRSASEPIEFPVDGSFGPFQDQLIIPDNNGPRLARAMLEKVKGQYQGASTLFLDGGLLKTGNNRVLFSPNKKSLFVGQTIRGWGRMSEGLQRIVYHDQKVFDIKMMSLTKTGFRLIFTKKPSIDAGKLGSYMVESFHYEDKWSYGSPKYDIKPHKVLSVKKIDELTYDIVVDGLKKGKVFDLKVKNGLNQPEDVSLKNRSYCYTINNLR